MWMREAVVMLEDHGWEGVTGFGCVGFALAAIVVWCLDCVVLQDRRWRLRSVLFLSCG